MLWVANRKVKGNDLSFFKIPAESKRFTDEVNALIRERRRLWLAALNLRDVNDATLAKKAEWTRVCGAHFTKGQSEILAHSLLQYCTILNMGVQWTVD